MIPIAYSLRNLSVRRSTSLAASAGLGLVVFVFASALMLSNGIKKTLGRAARGDVAVVLRQGAETELSSALSDEQLGLVLALKEVPRRSDGRPDALGEVLVVALVEKANGEGLANAQLRGVPDDVMAFRPDVKIVAGRPPRPGTDEAIVGQALRGRFKGFDLGKSFEIRRNRPLTIVGVFSSEGSAYESEVWTDRTSVQAAFGREGLVSAARVRLSSADRFEALKASIDQDPRLGLSVMRESEYYEKQGAGMSALVRVAGLLTAVLFSICAMLGAMITMHASVANRRREIGTLRALGFSRLSILAALLFESTALAVFGGGAGALAALAASRVRFSTMNFATFSEIVIQLEPTPGILLGSLALAALMGVLGGLPPAVRAARLLPTAAMRD